MPDLVTIKTFDTYISAQILKARLEAEGIKCFLKDEQSVTMYWFWSNALGGVKLQVFDYDKQYAEKIITTIEQEALLHSETPGFWDEEDVEQLHPDNKICIHCGSRNTRQNEYSKRSAAISILLLGFPLLFKSHKWHCFHCGEDF